jgi:predicted ATPase
MAAGQQAAAGFVGRSAELRLVDQALLAAGDGVGSLVLVTGVAGIGKSWFCREVIRRARAREFVTAWGGCWPEGGAPPLWPWQEILDGLIDDGGAVKLLLDDRGGTALDPERFTRFLAVRSRIAEACAQRPSVAVIDDLQDADPGAALLARFVGRQLSAIPLAFAWFLGF